MKKAMIAMMLLTGGLFAAPRVEFGVGIGVRAPVAVVRPACPGPGYVWTDGYYAPNGVWVAGFWAPPAVRVEGRFAPRPVYRDYARGYDHGRAYDRHDDHFRR